MNRIQVNTFEAPESQICIHWKSFEAAYWTKWEGELTNCDRKYVLHTTQNTKERKTAIPHSTFSWTFTFNLPCVGTSRKTLNENEERKRIENARGTRNKIPS